MRETKYKAWIIKDKKMVTVDTIHWNKGYGGALEIHAENPEFNPIRDMIENNNHEVLPFFSYLNHSLEVHKKRAKGDDFILLQYTGLKDKDSKDLDWWDRDIIQSFHFKEGGGKMHYLNHVIVWSDERGMWLAINSENYNKGDYSLTQDGNIMLYVYYRSAIKPTKIGNIHEHSHLLDSK